jgi:DNA replication protein DnaC
MPTVPHTDLQRRLFGERYVGASLSRLNVGANESRKACQWIEEPNGFLIITGPPGVGKTYFCSALIEVMPQTMQTFRAYHERALLKRLRDKMQDGGDYLQELHYLTDDDLIIVDDIGSSGHTDWREEILMELLDYRYSQRKPTVFTSNLNRGDFYNIYHPRIASRMFAKENTIIDLSHMKDQRMNGL